MVKKPNATSYEVCAVLGNAVIVIARNGFHKGHFCESYEAPYDSLWEKARCPIGAICSPNEHGKPNTLTLDKPARYRALCLVAQAAGVDTADWSVRALIRGIGRWADDPDRTVEDVYDAFGCAIKRARLK